MRLAATIARYLLGFAFTVLGLNGFFHFIPESPPVAPLALQYFGAISISHYIFPIYLLQVLTGLLLLGGVYVPLALTVLAGIIFNILVYHLTMDPGGIGPGAFVSILWVLVFAGYRTSFAPLFRAKPETL